MEVHVEGCVVYVLVWKRQFMHFLGQFACAVNCLILVHARKLQFYRLRGL